MKVKYIFMSRNEMNNAKENDTKDSRDITPTTTKRLSYISNPWVSLLTMDRS